MDSENDMRKEIKWSTPKDIKAGLKAKHSRSIPGKKDPKYCLKLKGPHEYTVYFEKFRFMNLRSGYMSCRGCGKLDHWTYRMTKV